MREYFYNIHMIRFIIRIYIYAIILDAVLTYFPQFRNQPWAKTLRQIADFTEKPIRKFLPPDLPFDVAPLIVIFLLNLIMLLW
jgi:YggT family protein